MNPSAPSQSENQVPPQPNVSAPYPGGPYPPGVVGQPPQQPYYPGQPSQQPYYPGQPPQQPYYPGQPSSTDPAVNPNFNNGNISGGPGQQSPYPMSGQPYPPMGQPPVTGGQYGAPQMAGGYPPSGYPPAPQTYAPGGQYGSTPTGYTAAPQHVHQQNLNMNPQQLSSGTTVAMSNMSLSDPAAKNTLPTSRVQLVITAKNLLDRDTFSKSDPVCLLYSKDLAQNQYVEVGRTEQIKNNLNPTWDKKFLLDYRFEERQIFKFSIYDWDGSSSMLADHDFLGSLECSLGEIVAAPNKKFERNLELPPKFRGKTSSSIVISAEELGTSKEIVHIKMNARGLDKKDWFGKSDPYVTISKKTDDNCWTQVHKTEIIKQTLDPDWHPFTIRLVSLTSGNPDRPLRFQVYDWDNDGSSDFIGEFETTYTQLASRCNFSENRGGNFPVINLKKKAKSKKYSNSGTINIEWMRVEEEKSFLDYIQSGVQIHFTVAVDFTASNGDPNHPTSLHYRNPHQDNQYVIAIKSVGEIIEDYDSDKSFPALGFGGKIPPDGRLSHEFFLNGSRDQPHCLGTRGILEAYYNSLNTVQLYGPTYFAPVIQHVSRFAKRFDDGNSYFVLLIITDGIICDMDATKEAIIEASTLPMSIIIIGVGQEDFSAMEFLDSDGKVLRHNGKAATRDIVQFVALRDFIPYTHAANWQQFSKKNLARAVLAELPDQFVGFMKARNSSYPTQTFKAAEKSKTKFWK